MAYFKDLTLYCYGGKTEIENARNIGWLSIEQEYAKGACSLEFITALKGLAKTPTNLYRGVHYCEFCPPMITKPIKDRIVHEVVRDCPSGNGEIHVKGSEGVMFVAPVLLVHYVAEHNYLPPEQFVSAVLHTKNA